MKLWFRKNFGDSVFIKEYWKLIFPVILFGFVFAIGPIIISYIFPFIIPSQASSVYHTFVRGNFLVQLYWYLGIAFVFAASPVIGNYIRKGNLKDIHSLMRVVSYNLMIINSIFFILFEALSSIFVSQLLKIGPAGAVGIDQLTIINYIRILGLNVFLYSMAYLYVIALAPFRMMKNNVLASFFSLSFYLLTTLVFLSIMNNLNQNAVSILYGLAVLYVLSLFVFLMYFFLLTKRKYIFWFKNTITNASIKPYNSFYLQFVDEENRKDIFIKKIGKFEIYLIPNPVFSFKWFSSGIDWNKHQFKELWQLGWAIYLDESLWVIANLVLEELSVSLPSINGWATYSNNLILVSTLFSGSIYAILDGWIILPQHFVSPELGLGNIQKAKQYGNQLKSWSYVIGLGLMSLIFVLSGILAFTTNINNNSLNVANGVIDHSQIVLLSFGLAAIFGITVLVNSIYQTLASLLTVGGSKWIQFANSFVTILYSFAILLPLIISIENSQGLLASGTTANFIIYYVISRTYVLIKLLIASLLWRFNRGLNSIATLKMNRNFLVKENIN